MPEINIIPSASIPRIPDVVIPNQTNLPTTTHVTRMLPPTFDMPCATVRTDGTKNSQLFTDDPAGNIVINCAIPFYEPLQYNAKDLVPIQEAQPPTNVEQPPIAETETPELPKIQEDDKVECPDPKKNNPRIGDLNAKGTEKVVETVLTEGKYFSTAVVGSYCTTHSFVSSIYLKPTTFSVPFAFKSPIRGLFFLGSGHSTLSSSGIFGTSGVSVSAIGGCSTFVGGSASCIGTKSLALYCNGS